MLQPRRLAARNIAHYLANQLGETVGQTVGYQVRGEHKVSAQTRLNIVTEGILTRMLQSDAMLTDVALVIFDEFHERNLHADFSLALCIEAQQALREDLRLLVMSATLDAEPILQHLPNAQLLQCEGRSYPIEYRYQAFDRRQNLSLQCVNLIKRALCETSGSLLVFLPGKSEIERVFSQLFSTVDDNTFVCRLYGQLDKKRQDQAIQPAPPGQRKIVLATNIAETSLTIEGISTVVDSGFEKVAHFHTSKGISQLKLQPISQASATQRAGRAGRLQAGHCYRLWAQEQHARMARQSTAPILNSDIATFVLEAALWGTSLQQLPLLDKPGEAQLASAIGLLTNLGLLASNSKLTPLGNQAARLGCHPRLAAMLIGAQQWQTVGQYLACVLVTLLENNHMDGDHCDIGTALHTLLRRKNPNDQQQIKQWLNRIDASVVSLSDAQLSELTPLLLALAFPDHIGKSRGQGRYQLANGSGARMAFDDPLAKQPLIVVGQMLLTEQADANIRYASAISEVQIQQHFSHLLQRQRVCAWNEHKSAIQSQVHLKLGSISLTSQPDRNVNPQQIADIWCTQISKKGLGWLQWPQKVTQLQQKLNLARHYMPEEQWPMYSDEDLLSLLEQWLSPFIGDVTTLDELRKLDWYNLLWQRLEWQQQQKLEQQLPERLKVPTGNQYRLHYRADGEVVLAVPMTEMYGLAANPSIANGRLDVTLELLSPAKRPLQTTRDLAGFWAGSYKAVQKEMKGRYPKHYWPDDPTNAMPTNRTKNKMKIS